MTLLSSSPTHSPPNASTEPAFGAREQGASKQPCRSTRSVLLAGNPNCGKTTLFNLLTGARQRVGNYPGVTVEKRVGRLRLGELALSVTDLPGTYSLSSYSPEERIAQEALLGGEGEVVVLVADATNLKRGLVLLAQLLQLQKRMVLCLNMVDEAERGGQVLDIIALSELLGFPVVCTVGHKGTGVQDLRDAIRRAARSEPITAGRVFHGELRAATERILMALETVDVPPSHRIWMADRLLVAEPEAVAQVQRLGDAGASVMRVVDRERRGLEAATGMDAALCVTDGYYGFVDGLLRQVVRQRSREDARATSDRIDAVVVNPVLGLPIFLAVMYSIFWLTFSAGEIPMGWIEKGVVWLGQAIAGFWPDGSGSPLRSLLVDGVVAGVGGVVVFLPNIVLLFLGLAVLEDSGYMARAAFIVDRAFHRFGLHGRSFVPLMTGFGCSVPGIMGARTMENERDRLTTMFVVPLMSCGARLPIWMLLIPAFFPPAWRAPALWGIYALGVVLALLVALVLRRSIFRGEESPFVMELPPYRLPTVRAVVTKMWDRSWTYLRKAGTVILGVSILMWVITAYPRAGNYQIDRAIREGRAVLVEQGVDAAPAGFTGESLGSSGPKPVVRITEQQLEAARAAEDLRVSIAGRIGRAIAPLLEPLGLDWKVGIGLIGAVAAKEVFVAQLGIVHALGAADDSSLSLRDAMSRDYSPQAGFALMILLLVGTPCMATVAVMRKESGSWRWALLQFGGLTGLAYLLALTFYQVSRLLG